MAITEAVTRLNAAIVARAPSEHQAEVRAILEAITQIREAAVQSAEARAFVKGVETGEQREAECRESGFQAGYRHALEQAWGPIDSSGRYQDEDFQPFQP